MESHIVKIKSISKVTHDVLRIELQKPDNYTFVTNMGLLQKAF